ncbi:MAG: NAD+ synthase [Snowella sp.]|nr:NAD+ synthase [Snowella sp.]
MKIAIAQLNPTIGDIQNNAQEILKAAQVASEQGADLLLTPELSLCGYPPKDLLLNPSFVQLLAVELDHLAQQLPPNLTVLVGTVDNNNQANLKGEKALFNSIALLYQGKIQTYFHKRLLPTYDVFDEDRYFESGKESHIFTIKNIKIGVTICEDLWNEASFWNVRRYEINPVDDLVALHSQLIINLSASPYTVNKQKLRESMAYHIVKRYQIPLIYVNQIGGNDDLIFDGNSFAVNRQGEVVGRAQAFKPDLFFLDVNEQRPDILPTQIQPLPTCEEAELFNALVLGVKDYVKKCGFSRVILGLSGGIDSSLVAAIATEAVGANQVLGVLMPSPYSSAHSIADAEALVNNLGIQSYLLPIGDLMKTYDQVLDPLFAGTEFGIAEENLQSRIRGNLLMAIANKFGHLLLSTGNKSEMAVGYCTLYGDMNGGLAVIADIPKMRVFSLCRWLNRDREIIPPSVLTKPPSAELKPGQVDQDSLPPYEILDDILDRLIHQHQSARQLIAAGFEPDTVHKVSKLVSRAEFKRKQAPPGLKVTDRAFGTGWRMPIASRW